MSAARMLMLALNLSTVAGPYVRDSLQDIFDWNALQNSVDRYTRQVPLVAVTAPPGSILGRMLVQEGVEGIHGTCHTKCRPAGYCSSADAVAYPACECALTSGYRGPDCSVFIPDKAPYEGTPKEIGRGSVNLKDVLTVFPSDDQPAVATVQVDLTAAHVGVNRVHAFVHVTGALCHEELNETKLNGTVISSETYQVCDAPYGKDSVLSAVLAPLQIFYTYTDLRGRFDLPAEQRVILQNWTTVPANQSRYAPLPSAVVIWCTRRDP